MSSITLMDEQRAQIEIEHRWLLGKGVAFDNKKTATGSFNQEHAAGVEVTDVL